MHDVTIAIIAGGRSRRMGQNKSFVAVQGKPMIEHILESVAPLKCSTIIITHCPYDYEQYNLPMFADVIPDQGALGGIYSALHHSSTPYVLCVACDMPFLNTDVLRHFLSLRQQADAVIAHIDDLWQTFPAVYSTSLLPALHQAIEDHHLQMQRLLNGFSICRMSPEDLLPLDPDLRTFTNINTPHELETVQI